jgi:hypothetical protein
MGNGGGAEVGSGTSRGLAKAARPFDRLRAGSGASGENSLERFVEDDSIGILRLRSSFANAKLLFRSG